jgi:2-polyprenyl-3-methyl-5-hydroxy-6-metoxy-1,4-benzoquinol methylase
MNNPDNKCYLCGEKRLEILKGYSWLVECQNCGLVYNPVLVNDPREVSQHFYDDVNVEFRKKIQSVLLKISRNRWNWLDKRVKANTGYLLEVGCGTGEFLDIARLAGWEVYGLELSKSFRTAALNWYNLELQGDELAQAGFKENSFDSVVLFHVFEHLQDPSEFLSQVSHVLKPGGWLFAIVPNNSGWTDNLFGKSNPTLIKKDHFFHYNPTTLQEIVSSNLFEIVEVTTYEPSHHFWTSIYGFLSLKLKPSRNGPTLPDKRQVASRTSNAISNLPYWLGSLSSVCFYPFRFWLQKVDRGHEIYLLCRRK